MKKIISTIVILGLIIVAFVVAMKNPQTRKKTQDSLEKASTYAWYKKLKKSDTIYQKIPSEVAFEKNLPDRINQIFNPDGSFGTALLKDVEGIERKRFFYKDTDRLKSAHDVEERTDNVTIDTSYWAQRGIYRHYRKNGHIYLDQEFNTKGILQEESIYQDCNERSQYMECIIYSKEFYPNGQLKEESTMVGNIMQAWVVSEKHYKPK